MSIKHVVRTGVIISIFVVGVSGESSAQFKRMTRAGSDSVEILSEVAGKVRGTAAGDEAGRDASGSAAGATAGSMAGEIIASDPSNGAGGPSDDNDGPDDENE